MKELNIENAYNLVYTKIEGWAEVLIAMLPNAVVALLVLGAFILIAKGISNLSRRLVSKITSNQALIRLLATVLYVTVVGIGIFTALSLLHLDKAVTSLLTGAGILGLALSFAFQDSASNFISGVFLALRKPLQIGDIVETEGTMGEVVEMSLRNTLIRSFQGQNIYIPNKEVYQNRLINYTQPGTRRVDISVGVSYGDNLQKAIDSTIDKVKELPFVIRKDETNMVFEEFGGSSINGRVMFWIDYPGEKSFLAARSEAIRVIKKSFDDNGIMIPFPIRTLDFGIKGGQKLSAMVNDEMNILNGNS